MIEEDEAAEYDRLVALCLETNYDQPGFDEASAIGAVDSMLDDESGSFDAVRRLLMGDQ